MQLPNSWYSAKVETKVYHNNTSCTEGNNIETYNVREGTGGKRLCEHCNRLNKFSGLFGGFPSNPLFPFPGKGGLGK